MTNKDKTGLDNDENLGNGMDVGEIPLHKGGKIMEVSERKYWEDVLNAWKAELDRMKIILETEVGNEKITKPAEKATEILGVYLRQIKLNLAKNKGLTPHELGRQVKNFGKNVKYARKVTVPMVIIKSSLMELIDSPLEGHADRVFEQGDKILVELAELQDLIQDELDFKFGRFQSFGSDDGLNNLSELNHYGSDFHVGKKTGC